jgi:hypothetical protein
MRSLSMSFAFDVSHAAHGADTRSERVAQEGCAAVACFNRWPPASPVHASPCRPLLVSRPPPHGPVASKLDHPVVLNE